MIANLGPHALFVVAAYAVALCVVVALMIWVALDHNEQRARLDELEASGVKRRSRRKRT